MSGGERQRDATVMEVTVSAQRGMDRAHRPPPEDSVADGAGARPDPDVEGTELSLFLSPLSPSVPVLSP